MKYLHISNRGSCHRQLIELAGVSTKRGRMLDNSVIGNKGSGAKLAAIAALRLQVSAGITSRDVIGSYFLEIDADALTVQGVVSHRVHYHYYLNEKDESGNLKRLRSPSDRVLEAFPDWDKPIGTDDKKSFKMLREYICNAYDEDKDFKCEVAEIRHFAPEGRTSVYLEYTDEIRHILDVPERYVKFLSQHHPHAVVEDIGEIWPKSDTANTRLFLQGVLADCDNKKIRSSVFDYSLYDKTMLSEERILKSPSNYVVAVGNLFAKLDDVDLCTTVLRGIIKGGAKFEEAALGTVRNPKLTPEARVAWLRAVHDVFGETVVIPAANSPVVNSDVVQIYGRVLLQHGSHEFRLFLKDLGIPRAEDVFPKNPEERLELVRFESLHEASQKCFAMAWKLFAKHFPDRAHYPVYFFHPFDDAMRRMLGFAGHGDSAFREIWIQTKTRTELPPLTSLLVTLIHESRHCKTQLYDHERGFNEAAEQDLLAEIMRQVAATIRLQGKPGEPFGDGKPIEPIFGDPSSKMAPVVGDTLPQEKADDVLPSGTTFGEIDITFEPDADALLDSILAEAEKK